MKPRPVGLVVVRIPEGAERAWVESSVKTAAVTASPGRCIVGLWEVSHEWRPTVSVEAWITQAILGAPTERPERDDEFSFFGNLVVRCYGRDRLEPERTIGLVIFRKRGEPAYRRAKENGSLVKADRLDTGAFSFTRDVANNTWHIRDTHAGSEIIARLARLLCWSDERVIEIAQRVSDRSKVRDRESADLIGVAVKVPYRWEPGSTRARQLSLISD